MRMSLWMPALRGVGQVMFQRNAATGALFLLGIALHSLAMALAAGLGSCIGTLLARLGKFPAAEVDDGLYGFNAVLVAIAAVLFYDVSAPAAGVGLIGIAAATALMRVMQKYSLRPYTFPFIAAVWVALWLLPAPGGAGPGPVALHAAIPDGFLQAFGQVMFQANSFTGLVFLAGIAVNSRRDALFASLGAAMAIVVALPLGWPSAQWAAGLYGYNAVLAAIAISLLERQAIFAVLAALLSIVITKAMQQTGIPVLTFPFVLATWLVILLRLRSQRD